VRAEPSAHCALLKLGRNHRARPATLRMAAEPWL
jgi:hypothetical protein